MENALSTLRQRFNLTRDQAIHMFNEICNEFNENCNESNVCLDHDETIKRAVNIVEIIFRKPVL